MPHATSPRDLQEEIDNILIQQALDPESNFDFNRELEPGEKAEDAIDFGDLSDDDLADDESDRLSTEPVGNGPAVVSSFDDLKSGTTDQELHELENGEPTEEDGFDDLFGENVDSHREDPEEARRPPFFTPSAGIGFAVTDNEDPLFQEHPKLFPGLPPPQVQVRQDTLVQTQAILPPATSNAQDKTISKEEQLQQELFAMSGYALPGVDYLPPPPENQEELLRSLWPKFERAIVPRFMELLPPKKTPYVRKAPPKKPKRFQPTKLNLDLAKDLEKSFRLPLSSSSRRKCEDLDQTCVISVPDISSLQRTIHDPEDMDTDPESEITKDVTWQDLQILCQDWDSQARDLCRPDESGIDRALENLSSRRDHQSNITDQAEVHVSKKRKLSHSMTGLLETPQIFLSSLHNPIHDTFTVAESVILDMNDTLLLTQLESLETNHWNQGAPASLKPSSRSYVAKGLNQRYNVSNDEAYDLLKANHQSKIRSTLGTLSVEHSLPAVRLQWPYYKTRLEKQEARSFHRPAIKFQRNEQIAFGKPRIIKKKHLKGRDTQSIFESTKDLSLGDNSHMLLLEYSEEYPTMLSNFGMGSRLINYYRRKNMEDVSRPKLDVGETAVLLPQDKSPFSVFGHIDPGQMTPAVYNSMFRAPVFRHQASPSDFVVVRNTTGLEGPNWCIRAIENLHVVGQEFPQVDVPGPHSRKVTTAAKNRLKMVSYRQIRRKPIHRISVAEVTKHFTDTTDMQNRQKMKEFMQFSKEHKEWEMRPGEAIPDEETVRALVKPEDVCLLESMQVGQQHLLDAGFTKADEDSDEDEGKEGRSIEQQLAPWFTSRNFINAAQGKAMLQLHGEGDPSGRGEAFSFIKTSMKGGFKAMGESVEDKLDAKKLKELGGHSYNVAKQQKSYEESIRRIWDAQKRSLSSTLLQSDFDPDEEILEESESFHGHAGTPRSELPNPAPLRRRDDETASQFSKLSTDSHAGKVLRITRYIRDEDGQLRKVEDVIDDPRVARQYIRRRHAREAENTTLSELKPTGDAEQDRRYQQRLEKELARLQRNKDRRIARDKQKGLNIDGTADSPTSPTSPAPSLITKPAGTLRKCANCGQVGHIKTNKKLCPMLNGNSKREDGFANPSFLLGPSNT